MIDAVIKQELPDSLIFRLESGRAQLGIYWWENRCSKNPEALNPPPRSSGTKLYT